MFELVYEESEWNLIYLDEKIKISFCPEENIENATMFISYASGFVKYRTINGSCSIVWDENTITFTTGKNGCISIDVKQTPELSESLVKCLEKWIHSKN